MRNAQENVLRMQESGQVVVHADRRIGSILTEQGKLVPVDIERIMELQATQGMRFGDAALSLGLVTAHDVHDAILRQYDMPRWSPGDQGAGNELVFAHDPFHPCAEEFRALRAQLLNRLSKTRVKHRALAVVSPGTGEGRSYLAANLALAFSQLGERTLLIDADLRSPRQHLIFGVPDRVGLTAVLGGRAGRGALSQIPQYGAFSLLCAGACPPNPEELLSRSPLRTLLHELRNQFDVILLDTPPMGIFADAQAVASHAGSALVLARKDHTRIEDTKDAIRVISELNSQLLGTVLTRF